MDPANKKEYTGIIKKLHNMQWLKKNSMSGHKDKPPEEPSKNLNLENSTSDSGNMASTSKTTDKASVIEKEAVNAWTKKTNIADTLFPNVQSLTIERLDEQEMLSLALTESIMTAQLEAMKLKEAEKEAQELERKNYLLVHSDSEDDSIWDKPNRRNVPNDSPEAIKTDGVKKDEEKKKHERTKEKHEKTKEKPKDLTEHVEEAELQIQDASLCTVSENSVKDDHKEDGKTNQDTVDALISDKSQNSNSQAESSVIQSKDLLEENKEVKTSECEKQFIKDNNDAAKHDKKQSTTRQKHASTAEKSISYPKNNLNRVTGKSSHAVKKEESKTRPTNSSSSTTHRLSSTEYKYPGNARKTDLSQNRQHEPEDVASKYVGAFYGRNDATRVANRRQSNSYRKYDTRYVLKQAGSTNEGRNSEPRKDFGTSCTESTLSRNAQSEPNRDTKQATIRKTESETIPQKLMQPKDKSNYERDLQESDNRQSDDNNNKSDKIIESVGENDSLSVESKKCTEQTENLMMLSDRPSSVMKRAEENSIRDNEKKNSNALNHSESSLVPRPILARNIPNNDVDVPSEMLRRQNVPNNIQRSVLQSSDTARDIFHANQNTMPPAELSYRNAILPFSAAVCQEIYNSNHSAVSPPPGFYNQQTFPVPNQWNSHMMSVQHQNPGPMCGNYLLPQQYSCAPFPESCFAGLETHQQAPNFAVPCGQAVHVINPMYGSCYTIPANMYEDMYRNSHGDAANNPSFPSTSGNTRNEMRSRENQDIRIGIDVRMNRCQNVYVPEQKQQQNFYASHNYGNPLISSAPYDDGSRRFDQLNQTRNAIMRLNYKCGDGAVDFTARVGAEDKTNQVQVPVANPREHLDSGFPARRVGIGRGRLRPRDV